MNASFDKSFVFHFLNHLKCVAGKNIQAHIHLHYRKIYRLEIHHCTTRNCGSKSSTTKRAITWKTIRYSNLEVHKLTLPQVLIIDNIGLLSSLYAYGTIAYIGGGFGKSIHNTLEAAAFGLPVIFGPNYQKFQEAKDLVELEAGFSIINQAELNDCFKLLQADTENSAGAKAKAYVDSHTGTTVKILKKIIA